VDNGSAGKIRRGGSVKDQREDVLNRSSRRVSTAPEKEGLGRYLRRGENFHEGQNRRGKTLHVIQGGS